MTKDKRRLGGLAAAGLLTIAAMLARKGTEKTWTWVTDEPPPREEPNSDVDLKDAVLWATVSGVVAGLTRLAVRRGLIFRD